MRVVTIMGERSEWALTFRRNVMDYEIALFNRNKDPIHGREGENNSVFTKEPSGAFLSKSLCAIIKLSSNG